MKLNGSVYAIFFFLLLGLFGAIQSLFFRYWESMLLPLFVSCLIVILSLTQLIRELTLNSRITDIEAKLPRTRINSNISLKLLGLIIGWTVAFALCVYIFGFYVTIPIFTFYFLKWYRRRVFTSIIFSCAILAFTYLAFELLLKIPLYPGLIFEYIVFNR